MPEQWSEEVPFMCQVREVLQRRFRGTVLSPRLLQAPAFAGLPGLVSKTWLADGETNTYGGVYVWRDREAMEAYKETDIYKGIGANPNFVNITAKDFAVMEAPTRVTRGPVEAAA